MSRPALRCPGPLSRRELLKIGLAGPPLWAVAHAVPARSAEKDRLDEARALHRRVPVFLGYCVFHPEQFRPSGGKQSDLEKFDAAGVRTFVASVGFGYGSPNQPYFQVGPREYVLAGPGEWLFERQLRRVDELAAAIKACPRTRLVRRAADLGPGRDGRSLGVIVHLIGNNHETDLGAVDAFVRHGVRATHPAMEYHSRWCASQAGMPAPALTGFGRKVIARLNERGVVIDTAHASDESARAMIEASSRPLNDTHTTSRDLVPQSRGLRDQTLRLIAHSGGVVGVHFADHMLTAGAWKRKYARLPARPRQWEYNRHVLALTKDPDERIRLRNDRATQEKFYRARGLPPEPPRPTVRAATLSQLADVIDYLVKLVGVEHVGIGGDVNGIDDDSWPEGMDHVGQLPRLTAELLRRGYKEGPLRQLLSDNWRRVFAKCLPAS